MALIWILISVMGIRALTRLFMLGEGEYPRRVNINPIDDVLTLALAVLVIVALWPN